MSKNIIFIIILLFFYIIICSTPCRAIDGEILIDQSIFQRYINAVEASHDERTSFYETTVCSRCIEWERVEVGDPPLPVPICKRWETYCCEFYLGRIDWSWSVVNPEFIVEECGIKLRGDLYLVLSDYSRMIPFEIPVNISFDTSTSQLKLHIERAIDDVIVYIAGEYKDLGLVDLAPYFDTYLQLSGSFTTLEDETVSGRVQGVSVQLMNGQVKITGNVVF